MKHIPAIFVILVLVTAFIYVNTREQRQVLIEKSVIEKVEKIESNIEEVNRVEREQSQIPEVFENASSETGKIELSEGDCSPSIEVINEYRFESSIGFTMSVTNDCNYILPGGYLTVKLIDKGGFTVAEKLIKHDNVYTFTSQIFEVVFKDVEELNAISYGLRYDR